MKKSHLRQIIKEEIKNVLHENEDFLKGLSNTFQNTTAADLISPSGEEIEGEGNEETIEILNQLKPKLDMVSKEMGNDDRIIRADDVYQSLLNRAKRLGTPGRGMRDSHEDIISSAEAVIKSWIG